MQNGRSACRDAVKYVLEEKRPKSSVSMRVFARRVRSISQCLEKGYGMAQYLSEKNTHENDSVCEWLCDNRYVFEENLSIVKKSLTSKRLFTGTDGGKTRYYHAFSEFYRCFDEALDSNKIMEFSSLITAEKPYPTLHDLYSLETVIRIVILESVSEVCKRLCSSERKSSDSHELEKAVLSLKNTALFAFENVFKQSPAEKILELDPAGAYSKMTNQTKRAYRESLYMMAKKQKLDEEQCARLIVEKCSKALRDREKHIGFYLIEEKAFAGRLYFFLLAFFTAAIQILLMLVHPAALLSFFPVWEAVKQVLDRLFGVFVPKRSVPALDIDEVPDGNGVLCVITTLLTGTKGDEEIFGRLEKMYLSNGGRNIYFGVLADRADSESMTAPEDEETLSRAVKSIKSLREKYGDVFFLFSRERRYCATQKKFMAYERKRGAVNALCAYLCAKGDDFDACSIKPDENLCRAIRYCITLDADTNLPLGSVLRMTGAMLHPHNRPEINREKHVVTKGHGIMQPKVSTTLSSAGRTRFSRIMCGAGGTELYSGASFDLEQSMFGDAVFCGKGIFDKYAFYEVTQGSASFEPDKILSHDSLEGARLRCACLSEVTLTDSFPKNELSYFKRAHRWIRGDVQNLPFVGKYTLNAEGSVISNSISTLYKFRIFDNVRRALLPVFSVLCVLCGIFLDAKASGVLFVSGIAYLFVPLVADIISSLFGFSFQLAVRRFFSRGVQTGLWQNLERSVMGLSNVCKSAFVSLDAIARSLFRMFVSRKNMLEWVTAAQTDEAGKDGIVGYVYKNLPSAFVGVLLFVFCPWGHVKIVGLLWFFHPAIAYYTSLSGKSRKTKLSLNDKNTLREYASDIWKFFAENVTAEDNFLPIDNIQFFPDTIKAHRTSPTNIGLYLVCTLCARDFGFIDSSEMCMRLTDTLSSIEKAEKWKGHLYNWYDTQNLSVLQPRFVSGVDSGNLLACILVVYEGISEYVNECKELESVRARLKRIYDNTQLLPIYDSEKDLFCIGAGFDNNGNAVLSDNRYDLLMSEARTLSFIAVSQRCVPVKHWQSLSRMPVRSGERIGLASWTGTAFEYFMPALFLPVTEGSLSYEALCFALCEQKKRCADTEKGNVFGISESAFFAFDYEMNYQYKAFGIPSLGLHRGLENDLVISPYSSFLGLCVSGKSMLSNLDRLKKLGMYGRYGFYEAADFTQRRVKNGFAKVKSVMSHHAGMSMASCANACFDNTLQRRFMSNKTMSAATELLEEKIPVDAVIKTEKSSSQNDNRPARQQSAGFKSFEHTQNREPVCSMLSDGKNKIVLSSTGNVCLWHDDVLISRANTENAIRDTLFVLCEIDGEVFYCACRGLEKKDCSYSFGVSLGEVRYSANIVTRDSKKFVFQVCFSLDSSSGNVFRISARLKGNFRKQDIRVRFALCFEPVLFAKSAYEAHPAFSSLFVGSEFDSKDSVLLFSRRKRQENDRECYLAVGMKEGTAFEYSSQKQVLCPFPVSEESVKGVFKADLSEYKTGACVDPYCLVRTSAITRKYEAEFLLSFSGDRENALANLLCSRGKNFGECKKELSEKAMHMLLSTKFYPTAGQALTEEERLLSACIYPERQNGYSGEKYDRDLLWRHGISGDVPIFVSFADTAYLCEKLERYVRAFMLLRLKGQKSELVLFCRDRDMYHKKSEARLREMLEKNGALGLLGRKNGIFIVNVEALRDKGEAILASASLVISPGSALSYRRINQKSPVIVRVREYEKTQDRKDVFSSGSGYFLDDNSYVAEKSEINGVYSNVLTGRLISTVVDAYSLGYTFCRNAAERRITPFYNDSALMESAEHVYAQRDGKMLDLCALSDRVRFFPGGAEYFGNVLGESYTVGIYVPEKLPVKLVTVKTKMKARLSFTVKPIMGRERSENRRISFEVHSGCVTFHNRFPVMFDETGFLFGNRLDENGNFLELSQTDYGFASGFEGAARAFFDNDGEKDGIFVFALGSAASEQTLDFVMKCVRNGCGELIKSAFAFSRSFAVANTECSDSDSLSKSLSLFFDTWLLYQNGACRFFARSGFYQSGGAFGFRDQLQDSLGLMYSHPDLTRAHIIRCCAHQFEQGDVLHWWHPYSRRDGHSHMGVRTKISDDYVFLPYAVSEYVKFTGDVSLLDVPVRYISADELLPDEHEKYISPEHSKLCESVYRHCLRALSRACERVGEHGLCLIGSGDWCDGLNRIGTKGKGESVWLTMFLCMVLEKFSQVCEKYDDSRSASVMLERRKQLAECIEKHGFDLESGYYMRAYTDDGRKIGVSSEKENKIELLPQAFATLSGIGDTDRRTRSLIKAFEELYDRENHIIKLFSPAYDEPDYDPGYIKGYCRGIRENGGQYTHAAVWMMMALLKACTDKELSQNTKSRLTNMGLQLVSDMLVPLRMRDEVLCEKYKAEPYVLSADIYSNENHSGRAGWTWYTGSASWLWRAILECFFCISFEGINTSSPTVVFSDGVFSIPFSFEGVKEISIKLPRDGFSLKVKYTKGEKNAILEDGRECGRRIKLTKGGTQIEVSTDAKRRG